ncbi:MAG: hypothetical protein OHK0029_43230 [Armatimonadaceae bacterium]
MSVLKPAFPVPLHQGSDGGNGTEVHGDGKVFGGSERHGTTEGQRNAISSGGDAGRMAEATADPIGGIVAALTQAAWFTPAESGATV